MTKKGLKTISSESSAVLKEKRSEFYAFAYPVASLKEIEEIRKRLKKKYYDARHHVYAFRLGYENFIEQSSDDKEPHNSSAPAVMGQIKSNDLTNILIVVVRYFGGKKLGIPGLINAYRTAAKMAIEKAKILKIEPVKAARLEFDFQKINGVMKIINQNNLNIQKMENKEQCVIELNVADEVFEGLKEQFKVLGVELKTKKTT